jgi:hypothetical protein
LEYARRKQFGDTLGRGIIKQIIPELDRDQPDLIYSGKDSSRVFNASNKEQYRKWIIEMFGELELAQKESNRVQPVIAPINNDIMSHNT